MRSAEQDAQSLHRVFEIGQLVVLHTGGDAHAVGQIDLVAAVADDIGAVRGDGHFVVGAGGAGGHIAVDGGHGTGQGAVGVLRQAGDGDLAGVAHMEEGPIAEGDVGHHLEVAVLAGDGGQRGAGAQHHAHLIGRVHVDDAGGGGVDVIVVGAGVQGVQLALQIVDVALHAGQAGGDGLQGGVIQRLHLALVLLHQGFDLLVGVACGLIGGVINQLLEFRKMQKNKLALSLEETDVIAFLYEIFLSFKNTSESKNIDFCFEPSQPAYKMFIDKGNLDKVTYNLLSNAFKYTPSNGKIIFKIDIQEDKQQLRIQVIDNGIGIPKEKRSELFKRFMQSSFSHSSVGVGLHLTHELVQVHKGNISYDENEGGGSVFTVLLPTNSDIYQEKDFLIPNQLLTEEEEQHSKDFLRNETSEDTFQPPVDPLNKRKVLIIEDDTDIREFLREEIGVYFEVEVAADGTSGFEKASTYDADLIVCDVLMPGMNGFEVTRKLKNEFTTSHIPIILLTALNIEEKYQEGIESGADAYITKPFNVSLLLARIFKLIELRDKLRQKYSNEPGLAHSIICTNDKDQKFSVKLNEVLNEHMTDTDFSVNDFAGIMGLGRTVFYKKVRGVTGYSPYEYLRVMRMKKAAEMLLTEDLTIAEVAYSVGINDPFYFSKCFKNQFGVSPSAYRKKLSEDENEPINDADV